MRANNNKDWLLYETAYDIDVSVNAQLYHPATNKEQNIFTWTYNVQIKNFRPATIQVMKRYWQIFDRHANSREIIDSGVVGQQPIIRANDLFEYASQVTLFSDPGLMLGKYLAIDMLTGGKFCINIPAFSLDSFINKKLAN